MNDIIRITASYKKLSKQKKIDILTLLLKWTSNEFSKLNK